MENGVEVVNVQLAQIKMYYFKASPVEGMILVGKVSFFVFFFCWLAYFV